MTWLAIYGACLSTALVLAKLIPEWPVASVVPAETPSADRQRTVCVGIFNPAKRPLFLVSSDQFPRRNPKLNITEQRPLEEEDDIMNAILHNLATPGVVPRVYVPAGGTAMLTVSGIELGEPRILVLWWHRNWLFRYLRFPIFVRVSSGIAATVNRTPPLEP